MTKDGDASTEISLWGRGNHPKPFAEDNETEAVSDEAKHDNLNEDM